MGSSASCSFVLTPIGKTFYWTGETISGHVVLTVDNSITVKSINMNMIGQRVHRERNGDCGTITVRKYFFVQDHSLFIPVTNGISYGEDGYYIQPNTYRWPFSVCVPNNLLPSLVHVGEYIPDIEYFMRIDLERARFKRNIRSQVCIRIMPRVPRPRDVWPLESEESNFRDLHIYGKLSRNYLLVGEPYITLELSIQNPSHTTIKEIIVSLIQRRLLSGKDGRVPIFQYSLPDIVDFQNDHLHRTFQVPTTLGLIAPSSYYKNLEKSDQSYIVEYVLEVKFKTRLFFTNATLEFPIIVANSERSSPSTISP